MQLPLPVSYTRGVQLVTVDYVGKTIVSPAGAAGSTGVQFDPVDAPYMWRVERISTRTTSVAPTQLVITAGTRVMDGTYGGNFAFADESSPILVQSGEALGAVWYGIDTGAKATIDIQYELIRREVN